MVTEVGGWRRRWVSALFLGIGVAACSGKVASGSGAHGGAMCQVDSDCLEGSCVNGACWQGADASAGATGGAPGSGHFVTGGSSGTGGATGGALDGGASLADATTRMDAAISGALDGVCFSIPDGPCGNLYAPSPVGQAGGWSVGKALVSRGGDGFALEVSRPAAVANQGTSVRAVYMDRAGGCVRPISEVKNDAGVSWNLIRAASGGDTLAAILRCSGRFSCGTELHRNGSLVADLEAFLLPYGDAYGDWTHEIAVASDGSIFVATGPSLAGSPGNRLLPDRLTLTWVPKGATATSAVTLSDSPAGLVAVDAVDVDAFHGAALILRDPQDGGSGASHLDLLTRDATRAAVFYPPPEVTLTGLKAHGDAIALMGEAATASGPQAWFGLLGAQDLVVRWQTTSSAIAGLPFGVGLGQNDTLFAGVVFVAAGLELLSYDAGGIASPLGSYPPPVGQTYSKGSSSLDVAPDGTLLIAANESVTYCPAAP